MFEQWYLAEQLREAHRAHMRRLAQERSWLENLLALAWLLLRAALRGMGYGLLLTGQALLRLTQPPRRAGHAPANGQALSYQANNGEFISL